VAVAVRGSKNGVVSLALDARCEQAEVSGVVAVVIGYVIGQRYQEFRCRVDGLDNLFGSGVLRQKPDFLTADVPEPMLSDRRTAARSDEPCCDAEGSLR
jgi:hypothetical protein